MLPATCRLLRAAPTFACTRARARANVACDDDDDASNQLTNVLAFCPSSIFPHFACYIFLLASDHFIFHVLRAISCRYSCSLGVPTQVLRTSPTLSRNYSVLSFDLTLSPAYLSIYLFIYLFIYLSFVNRRSGAHLSRPETHRIQHNATRKTLLFHIASICPFPFYNAFLPFSLVCISSHMYCTARAHVFLEKPWTFTMGAADSHRRLAELPA